MWIYPSPVAMDVSKVGIIVSRKVSAHATDRNRWKRRVREVFRVNQFLIKKGKWIVLQVKPGKKTPAFQEIEAEIKKLFREGAIWQAS